MISVNDLSKPEPGHDIDQLGVFLRQFINRLCKIKLFCHVEGLSSRRLQFSNHRLYVVQTTNWRICLTFPYSININSFVGMFSIKSAPGLGAFCCSMDPVDRTRWLRSEDFDLRSQQDRKMGFCEFNQIRRRCQNNLPSGRLFFVALRPMRAGAKHSVRRRRFFRCLSNQKYLRIG